jgi:hypothetical protein
MRHAGLIVVCTLALAGSVAGRQAAPPAADTAEALSAAALSFASDPGHVARTGGRDARQG